MSTLHPAERATIAYVCIGEMARDWSGAMIPVPWYRFEIYDRDTGERIDHVCECNAKEAWLERFVVTDDGKLQVNETSDGILTEMVNGNFRIRYAPEDR